MKTSIRQYANELQFRDLNVGAIFEWEQYIFVKTTGMHGICVSNDNRDPKSVMLYSAGSSVEFAGEALVFEVQEAIFYVKR